MWKALSVLLLCGCGAGEPGIVDIHDGAGGGGAVNESGATGGAAGAEACDTAPRPRRLRQVRVVDSRGLEPETIALAYVPEPQTLWLPPASRNIGAVVIVKEARGVDRRLTVYTTGKDVFLDDGSVESTTTDAWVSRTFMVARNESGVVGWTVLDAPR